MPEFHQGTLVVTQPPHFPTMYTRETCAYLVAQGFDENQIAVVLRCTPDDVRRHYAVELEHGLMLINSRVMSAVLHQALYKDDVAAMKLWLINKAGWRAGDSAKLQLPALNPDGTPVAGGDGNLTLAQRREVIASLLTRATQHKRLNERVIEAEVVESTTKPNGRNGANGSGHGTNGGGGANGTKHR